MSYAWGTPVYKILLPIKFEVVLASKGRHMMSEAFAGF